MNLHVFRTPQEKRHWSVGGEWVVPWRFADDFHVYGFEWGREELRWFVDGVLVRTVANTHWHQPLHLIFDSETMPDWFGMPNDADLPSTFSIEYVRAWAHPTANVPTRSASPKIAGPYVRVYIPGEDVFPGPDPSSFKAGQSYSEWVPNDHTILKGPEGRWHAFGITHPKPPDYQPPHYGKGVHEAEWLLFHAVAPVGTLKQHLKTGAWRDQAKVLAPSARPGEIRECHAPFIVGRDGPYRMIYGPISNSGAVSTSGASGVGMYGRGAGGEGGDGGEGDGIFGSGGAGLGSGDGGAVSITNSGAVTTIGTDATGLLAQSVGGFAGSGAEGGGIFAWGGSGNSAGHGGAIGVVNSGGISTMGSFAYAIHGQSVGGGGGSGGSTSGVFSWGGSGQAGGNGGTVTIDNAGQLRTAGREELSI